MQNIPVFTTDTGVSTLIFKEIPYKKVAFIRVQDVQPGGLNAHLEECARFCVMAGAERILAGGEGDFSEYPLHSVIWRMSMPLIPREPEANLWPVTAETVGQWREAYNRGMAPWDNHATLTARDEPEILASGGAYFVHRDGNLLGLGWVRDNELLALVSTRPGMGETVARTLFSLIPGDGVTLEVASTNRRAIRLYERMGFLKTGEVSRWYRISGDFRE